MTRLRLTMELDDRRGEQLLHLVAWLMPDVTVERLPDDPPPRRPRRRDADKPTPAAVRDLANNRWRVLPFPYPLDSLPTVEAALRDIERLRPRRLHAYAPVVSMCQVETVRAPDECRAVLALVRANLERGHHDLASIYLAAPTLLLERADDFPKASTLLAQLGDGHTVVAEPGPVDRINEHERWRCAGSELPTWMVSDWLFVRDVVAKERPQLAADILAWWRRHTGVVARPWRLLRPAAGPLTQLQHAAAWNEARTSDRDLLRLGIAAAPGMPDDLEVVAGVAPWIADLADENVELVIRILDGRPVEEWAGVVLTLAEEDPDLSGWRRQQAAAERAANIAAELAGRSRER